MKARWASRLAARLEATTVCWVSRSCNAAFASRWSSHQASAVTAAIARTIHETSSHGFAVVDAVDRRDPIRVDRGPIARSSSNRYAMACHRSLLQDPGAERGSRQDQGRISPRTREKFPHRKRRIAGSFETCQHQRCGTRGAYATRAHHGPLPLHPSLVRRGQRLAPPSAERTRGIRVRAASDHRRSSADARADDGSSARLRAGASACDSSRDRPRVRAHSGSESPQRAVAAHTRA